MKKRIVLAVSLAIVFAACATVPPTPPPDPGPTDPNAVTLRWLRSGAPVDGARVELSRQLMKTLAAPDANGVLTVPATGFDAAAVHLPSHDYAVVVTRDPARPGELRVPEPVRLRGRVTTANGGGGLRLQLGTGPRRPVLERHLAERRGPFPKPGDRHVFGDLELPDSSTHWQTLEVGADGSFVTPPVTSEAMPQLVASDDAGGFAALDVTLPAAFEPGATIDAGTIAVGAPTAIEIVTDLPRNDLLVLEAALRTPALGATRRAEVARHLSMLDRVDDLAFEFGSGRGPVYLPLRGTTRIAGLPPLGSVEVGFFGASPLRSVRRTVDIVAGQTATVRVSAEELGWTESTVPAPRAFGAAAGPANAAADPLPATNLTLIPCNRQYPTNNEQYPLCQGMIQTGPTTWRIGQIGDCILDQSNVLTVTNIGEPGQWQFTYLGTPFQFGFTGVGTVTEPNITAPLTAIPTGVDMTILRFCEAPQSGSFCLDKFVGSTPFQISSFVSDADSFEGTADGSGNYAINCINTNPIYVYVDWVNSRARKRYRFDGEVTFDDRGEGSVIMTVTQSSGR